MQSFSAAAERLFGHASAEMLGKNPGADAVAQPRTRWLYRRYLRTGERRIIGVGRVMVGERKTAQPSNGTCCRRMISGTQRYTMPRPNRTPETNRGCRAQSNCPYFPAFLMGVASFTRARAQSAAFGDRKYTKVRGACLKTAPTNVRRYTRSDGQRGKKRCAPGRSSAACAILSLTAKAKSAIEMSSNSWRKKRTCAGRRQDRMFVCDFSSTAPTLVLAG